jgi:hypothetical protein
VDCLWPLPRVKLLDSSHSLSLLTPFGAEGSGSGFLRPSLLGGSSAWCSCQEIEVGKFFFGVSSDKDRALES